MTRPHTFVRSLFLALSCVCLLGACEAGSTEADGLALRDGNLPSDPPAPCGDAIELPSESVMLLTEEQELLVSVGFEDPQMNMSGAGAREYWCECAGSGACQVQVVGNYAQCYSQSCTKCELKSRRVRGIKALEQLVDGCDGQAIDTATIEARLARVAEWTSDHGYPAPSFETSHEAVAPDGFGLVAELVAGRMITYAVPLDFFDEEGELIGFVGPSNEGAETLMQAGAGVRATCSCEGSGECAFEANGLCKGVCATQGSQRGCVVRTSKPLIPIK